MSNHKDSNELPKQIIFLENVCVSTRLDTTVTIIDIDYVLLSYVKHNYFKYFIDL